MNGADFRWVLSVDYDGSQFYGWQYQPQYRTIQGALYTAVRAFLGERLIIRHPDFLPHHLIAAGRTDRGVHARAQIVSLDVSPALHEATRSRSAHAWTHGINTHLPPDIRINAVRRARADFSARQSAMARHYRYVLLSRPIAPARYAAQVGWTWRTLSLSSMQQAMSALIGTHDFSSFRASECQAKTPIRTMKACSVEILPPSLWADTAHGQAGDVFVFHFHADAFLHHMIRNLIGSLVEVGSGQRPPSWLGEVLLLKDRTQGGMTFSPNGLIFWQADYPPDVWVFEGSLYAVE